VRTFRRRNVLTKIAGGNIALEVPIRRRDQTDIDWNRCSTADLVDLTLLERAEELGLNRKLELADLVEKERPAGSELEFAFLPSVRSSECSLLVTEQLAFHNAFRQCRAVDDDDRPGRPGTIN
jgi:hypothetical protein